MNSKAKKRNGITMKYDKDGRHKTTGTMVGNWMKMGGMKPLHRTMV